VDDRALLLEAASRIGTRLARQACWQGEACAWDTERGTTGGDLYDGTGGIALFLAELTALTGDAEIARAAGGAVRHAAAWAAAGPPRGGFYTGDAGVAWAAARAAGLLGREELAAPALLAVRRAATAPPGERYDVTSGAAGTVLGLLLLRPWDEDALGAAAALGRHLLERAVMEPWGWSWPADGTWRGRNLLGYAHGASGIGHALLELSAATGDPVFRHGAEQAWLYERRFFHPPSRNWADFRLPAEDPGPDAPLPWVPRTRTAWCSGAGGIGLARTRGALLLGDPVLRREVEVAVQAVRARIRPPGFNASLCHGASGTAELLAHAADALGDPTLRKAAGTLAGEMCREFELAGHPWPCGTRGGRSDPGLMVGEAGMGHLLLRLAEPSIPSVLLPVPHAAAAAPAPGGPGVHALRMAAVRAHFPVSATAVPRLAAASAYTPPDARGPVPDPHAAYVTLCRLVDGEADPARRALLADAFAPERTAYEGAMGVLDRAEEGYARGEGEADGAGWFRRTELARVVETQRDWTAWAGAPAGSPVPEPVPVRSLLLRGDNRVQVHRLAPLAAAVLDALTAPGTLDDVAARVSAGFAPGAAPPADRLGAAVLAQLRALHEMGAVAVDASAPPGRLLDRLAAAACGDGDPAPPSVRARAVLARAVETVRPLLEDALQADLVAASTPARMRMLLQAACAGPLFEPLLAVCEVDDPRARLAALRALLDTMERCFGGGELLVTAE
jgi:hypothetical protein